MVGACMVMGWILSVSRLRDKTMKAFFWTLSFVFLTGATLAGIGASIGALEVEWFAVCLLCIAGMFSAAEWADTIEG